MNSKWSEKDREFIKKNAENLTDSQIAEKLQYMTGRKVTVDAVRKQRQKLGIWKASGRGICEIRKK